MKHLKLRLVAATALFALNVPAGAQMKMAPGMSMPGMKMPPAKKAAPKKASAKKKPAATAKGALKGNAGGRKMAIAVTRKATRPHAGRMSSMPGMAMPAGHDMSTMPGMNMPAGRKKAPATARKAGPKAAHDMSTMPGMDMPVGENSAPMPGMTMPAGQDMSSMPGMTMPGGHEMSGKEPAALAGTDLAAGHAPPPPIPTDRAADDVYGAPDMHMGRHHLNEFHGGQRFSQVMFNLAEAQFRNGGTAFEWNGQAWYGGDINRLWVKSEGDGSFHRSVDRAEVQAVYSHALDPYFNIQGGVRYDFKPNPSRVYATLAIEGLAQSFFELEGSLYLSNKGELLARAEGYYDQRITQRLILQPRAELNFAAQNTRETRTGAGLSDAEIGLRLRYDIRREFAPYVGVQYRRAFGRTERYFREAGEDPNGVSLLTGVRLWF